MAGHIIAIDPGLSGALVSLDITSGQCLDYLLMPAIQVGKSKRLNGASIASWLDEWKPEHAFLEKVGSMPKQGVSSTFTFGHAAGFIEGLITGAKIPITLVPPPTWKKHAGLIGTEKDASRSRAVQLFPDLRILDTKAKGQAVADALHIARYGLTTL